MKLQSLSSLEKTGLFQEGMSEVSDTLRTITVVVTAAMPGTPPVITALPVFVTSTLYLYST